MSGSRHRAMTEEQIEQAYAATTNHPRIRRLREQAWVIMVIMQDSGTRPNEVFPMRIEDIDWGQHRIWIPRGKTRKARRFVAMSDRMEEMLRAWCGTRTEGWVFSALHRPPVELTPSPRVSRRSAIGPAWTKKSFLISPDTPTEPTPWPRPGTPLRLPTQWDMWT